jgi:transcriptional regulator GlxA family with amidase domain
VDEILNQWIPSSKAEDKPAKLATNAKNHKRNNSDIIMIEKNNLKTEYISRINKTFDYIESNIEKPMTLEELATVANFSKFHFNRIFQSIVGETPFQFILRVRLEKAATFILTNKNESISEITNKCVRIQ